MSALSITLGVVAKALNAEDIACNTTLTAATFTLLTRGLTPANLNVITTVVDPLGGAGGGAEQFGPTDGVEVVIAPDGRFIYSLDLAASDVIEFTFSPPASAAAFSILTNTGPPSATAVDAEDIACNTTLVGASLTPIRDLTAGEIDSDTSVGPASLQPVRDIAPAEVDSETTITEPSVTFTWDLNAGEVDSETSITAASLQPIRALDAEEVDCSTSIDPADLQPIRDLAPAEIDSETSIGAASLQPVRLLQAEEVDSETSITAGYVEISGQTVDVNAGDIACNTSIADASIQPIRAVDCANLNVDTTLPATLQPIRPLNAEEVDCSTTIEAASLQAIRPVDANEIDSETSITAASLQPIRDVSADNLNIDTSLVNASLQPIRDITAEDLNVDTTLPATLHAVRLLQVEDIACDTHITEGSVSGELTPADIVCDTNITAGSIQPIRDLTAGDIASETTLPATLQPIRPLNAEEVDSETSIDPAILNVIKDLYCADISCLTSITAATLQAIRDLTAEEVDCEVSIDPAILNVIRALDASNIPSATDIAGTSLSIYTAISGSTTWGQASGVLEDNTRTFVQGIFEKTGTITGSGDNEALELEAGQYAIFEMVNTGVHNVEVDQNVYYGSSADEGTLSYRTGATQAACLVAGWNNYTGAFSSLGYAQIKVEN